MMTIRLLFPEGKRKAFTTSYDDGVHQDRTLIRVMQENGIVGTFNLNSGRFGIRENFTRDGRTIDASKIENTEIAALYEKQEVASHALDHMNFEHAPSNVIAYQVVEDRKNLEKITGKLVRGFAYPYGYYDKKVEQVLADCGICYARTVCSTHAFDLPEDFLAWHPTCHHDDCALFSLLKQFCEEESPYGQPQVFYLWGHAYEFDEKDNWDRIKEALSYVGNHKEKLWMATNGMIYDYVTSFHALVYSCDGTMVHNPTAQKIWVELDGKQYVLKPGDTCFCK